MAVFTPGSLVQARGREWVVLPESAEDFLVLRPLSGSSDDVAGVFPDLEAVESASFPPPDPTDLGDAGAARLLRDALQIGFESTGGPFRSLAGLAVDPRPYQFVPLLMALRQEITRLLIADDVGIGKTVEAGLIASELLAQGSAARLTVLTPPSLAEQWKAELYEKFGLRAELVLASTVTRLQRSLSYEESIFERYPITIVSTDFIKAHRRRDEFLRTAPDLVIVDEAHTCVTDDGPGGATGRTQRYRLLRELADDEDRHLILVTATPHSGNEGAFRNLLGLLHPDLKHAELTTDSGRQLLARHLVQRRRADIREYLGTETHFPKDRRTLEEPYSLSPAYKELFDDAVAYARGQVQDESGTKRDVRVRWWSALALLRSIASSPAAAVETLEARTATAAAESESEADAIGRAIVLDQVEDDTSDDDAVAGARGEDESRREASILNDLRRRAEALTLDDDAKLSLVIKRVRRFLKDGISPIVFCRYIATAHYVTEALRANLKKVDIQVVTGELSPDDRSARVTELLEGAAGQPRVLVATDCLSEGINLQDGFQSVIHYDLAWNPTRHEQREGRVDRFGQRAEVVHAVTVYGENTGIDGIVLDVLLRKHAQIRKDLGISVPVPSDTNDRVLAALLEGVLLRGAETDQMELDLGLTTEAVKLEEDWTSAAETERASRSRYAQMTIRPEEVAREVAAARSALGKPGDVQRFVTTALAEMNAAVVPTDSGIRVDTGSLPGGVRDAVALGAGTDLEWVRELPAPASSAVMVRTDDRTRALARFVLDGALEPTSPARIARRAGMITTDAVREHTTLLLLRIRVHLTLPGKHSAVTQVAEAARPIAFRGVPRDPQWLTAEEVHSLFEARPTANTPPDVMANIMTGIISSLPRLEEHFNDEANQVADEIRDAHVRVRTSARGRETAGQLGIRGLNVRPQLPVDVLGVYAYRPGGNR